MILGIIFGVIIALILGLVLPICLMECYETKEYVITLGIYLLIVSIFTIGGILVGKYEDKYAYEKYINSYISQKEVYEESLKSDNLTELEKINLVKNVAEINSELEERKVEYKKWHYYYLDYSKIEKLERIEIK